MIWMPYHSCLWKEELTSLKINLLEGETAVAMIRIILTKLKFCCAMLEKKVTEKVIPLKP